MHFFQFKRLQKIEAEYPAVTKLTDESVVAFGIAAIGFFISFMTNMVLTHVLNTADYGDFCLCASVIGFLGGVSLLGNDQSTVKFIPDYFKLIKNTLLHGIMLYYGRYLLIMIAVVLLISWGMYAWMQSPYALDPSGHIVWRYLWIVPFSAVASILAMLLRSFKRSYYALITQNVLPGLLMMLLVGIVYYWTRQKISLDQIMWIYFSSVFGAIIVIQLVGLIKVLPWNIFQESPQYSRKVWFTMGLQLLLSLLVYDGESSIVNVTLKFTGHPSAQIGLFSVAMTIYAAAWLGCAACSSVLNPFISPAADQKDTAALQRLNNIGSAIIFLSGLFLALCFAFFGKVFLGWFGAQYVQAYSALLILSFGSLIAFAGGMTLNLLEYAIDPNVLMKITLQGTIVIILLGIPLCRYFGVNGGAVEVVLIESGLTLLYAYKLKQILKIKPFGII